MLRNGRFWRRRRNHGGSIRKAVGLIGLAAAQCRGILEVEEEEQGLASDRIEGNCNAEVEGERSSDGNERRCSSCGATRYYKIAKNVKSSAGVTDADSQSLGHSQALDVSRTARRPAPHGATFTPC